MSILTRFKAWRERRKILDVQAFAHAHRNYLVIVCDPKDDSMFATFRGKQVTAKMRSEDGLNHHIVKNMLKHSTFEREIDRFIGGLIFGLKIPLDVGSNFFAFLDGALFNISKSLKKTKDPYAATKD